MTTKQITEKKVTPRKPAVAAPAPIATPVVVKKDARKEVVLKGKTNVVKPITQVAAGVVVKFFVFVEGARPVSGSRLQAHTHAAMRFLGLTDAQAVRKVAVLALMGPRAIKHHSEIGNFTEVGDKITLTERGVKTFALREESVDKKMSAAFYGAITKGKTDEAYSIRESGIYPMAMTLR